MIKQMNFYGYMESVLKQTQHWSVVKWNINWYCIIIISTWTKIGWFLMEKLACLKGQVGIIWTVKYCAHLTLSVFFFNYKFIFPSIICPSQCVCLFDVVRLKVRKIKIQSYKLWDWIVSGPTLDSNSILPPQKIYDGQKIQYGLVVFFGKAV